MKITFLNPCISETPPDHDGGEFSFGLATLSSQLRQAGHETSLIQITADFPEDVIKGLLEREEADLYAIYGLSHFLEYIRKWVGLIKRHTTALVACGGVAVTIVPEDFLEAGGIDVLCIGEGDAALVELADSLARGRLNTDIENLWFRLPDGQIKRNPLRPLVGNLDDLPPVDTQLFAMDDLRSMKLRIPNVPVMVSRGCPYSCSYCGNEVLKRIYNGRGHYPRYMSAERAIEEVQHMLGSVSAPATVSFWDNTFNFSKSWVRRFCALYETRVGVPFAAMGRVEGLDAGVVDALGRAGCYKFTLGIESGSERIRYDVLNRKMPTHRILEATGLLKEAGIQIASYNMCGLPTETPQEMLETIKLNARAGVDLAVCAIFWPYKGTRLYQLCADLDLLDNTDKSDRRRYTSVFQGSILDYPPEQKAHLEFSSKWFPLLMYLYRQVFDSPPPVARQLEPIVDELYVSGRLRQMADMLGAPGRQRLIDQIYVALEEPLLRAFGLHAVC